MHLLLLSIHFLSSSSLVDSLLRKVTDRREFLSGKSIAAFYWQTIIYLSFPSAVSSENWSIVIYGKGRASGCCRCKWHRNFFHCLRQLENNFAICWRVEVEVAEGEKKSTIEPRVPYGLPNYFPPVFLDSISPIPSPQLLFFFTVGDELLDGRWWWPCIEWKGGKSSA